MQSGDYSKKKNMRWGKEKLDVRYKVSALLQVFIICCEIEAKRENS